jgi:hypothetical protein
MKYTILTDPGHGWLKVPIAKLIELNIWKEISDFSYVCGKYAYLEEDSDLSIFHRACEKAGEKVIFDEKHTDRASKIRKYAPYFLQFSALKKIKVNNEEKFGFLRGQVITIASEGIPNSDKQIIEDEQGFRYRRNIEAEFYFRLENSKMFCFFKI